MYYLYKTQIYKTPIMSFLLAIGKNKQVMQFALLFLMLLMLFASTQVTAGGLVLGFGEGKEYVKGLMQGDVGSIIALVGLFIGGIAMLWWNWKVASSVIVIICLYLFLPEGIDKMFTATF